MKCKRQEEGERAQMEARECHAAKEYAQVMLEWGRVIQGHNESMQRFLEVRYDISFFRLFVTVEHSSLIFSITLILWQTIVACWNVVSIPEPLS
jgi:hypothetical protein